MFFNSLKFSTLIFLLLIPLRSIAFTCEPYLNLNAQTTIPVAINNSIFEGMKTRGVSVELVNLKDYITCSGKLHSTFQDAVRIKPGTAMLGPLFSEIGVVNGFVIYDNQAKYSFADIPLASSEMCVWPSSNCDIDWGLGNDHVLTTKTMDLVIGLNSSGAITELLNIPAGSEIARFKLQQRGRYIVGSLPSWGENFFELVFVSANDISIPSKTCTVNEESVSVKLPNVDTYELRKMGSGRYPLATKFSLNLACDVGTRINASFDATPMENHLDVIKNTTGTAKGVGIQITDKTGSSIVLGEKKRVTDSAEQHEVLNYEAHYYYDGGSLSPGTVKSLATVVFDYM